MSQSYQSILFLLFFFASHSADTIHIHVHMHSRTFQGSLFGKATDDFPPYVIFYLKFYRLLSLLWDLFVHDL
eukprot:m.23611 g.23611  ORF g.23611 m.23611 type:complete len:72 (+) comp8520_c0_seq1:1195-1410(+)